MLPDTRPDSGVDRLDSWKDIAAYLRRDVSTVQRWEKKQGLPVHRHIHDKQGSVYAFKSELDQWWRQGAQRLHSSDESSSPDNMKAQHTWLRYAAAAVVIVTVAMWWWLAHRPVDHVEVVRSTVPLPADAANAFPVISPDGLSLVYQHVVRSGPAGALYVKALQELEGRPLPGTEGALQPFFSPDGKWIGYFAGGKMFKVPTQGGAPTYLADAPDSRGGTWLADDTIAFAADPMSGLSKVAASGGTASPLTKPDRSRLERTHRWPYAVPGENTVVFTVHTASERSFDDADIEAINVSTRVRTSVVRGGSNPLITESGHLLFSRRGQIWSAPFDRKRSRVTGRETPVVDQVMHASTTGRMAMTLSASGTLIYAPGGDFNTRELLWADRTGRLTPAMQTPGRFSGPRISPDGNFVVVGIDDAVPRVYMLDVRRNTFERLTEGWDAEMAFWSHDGARVGFTREGFDSKDRHVLDLVSISRVRTDEAPLILHRGKPFGNDWSPDGSRIALAEPAGDVSLLRVDSSNDITPVLSGPDIERAPRFSPNGRWLAYMSNRSGRFEVYVIELNGKHRRWQISNQGGVYPVWSRDGHELYYRRPTPPRMMAVRIDNTTEFSFKQSDELFETPPGVGLEMAFDVAPDGRFIIVSGGLRTLQTKGLVMVQNWFEELRQKVPIH